MGVQHSAETCASLSTHGHPLAEIQSPSTEDGREKENPPVSYVMCVLISCLSYKSNWTVQCRIPVLHSC